MAEDLPVCLFGSPCVILGDATVAGFVPKTARTLHYSLVATFQPRSRQTLSSRTPTHVSNTTTSLAGPIRVQVLPFEGLRGADRPRVFLSLAADDRRLYPLRAAYPPTSGP